MAYKKTEEIYLIYIETRSFIKIRKNFKMYNTWKIIILGQGSLESLNSFSIYFDTIFSCRDIVVRNKC